MRVRTLLAWIAVGLVGLALAAGVTYAATQLSSQRIGLSAEPPSAGEELAPRTTSDAPSRTTRNSTHGGSSTSGEPANDPRAGHPAPSKERVAGSHGGGARDLDD
jgi:hypothetical protein